MDRGRNSQPGNWKLPMIGVLLLLVCVLPAGSQQNDAETGFRIRGPENPYLSGRITFSLDPGQADLERVAYVNWYLDGRMVQRSSAPPYQVTMDLGPDVLPHRISAAAFSHQAEQLWAGDFRSLGLAVAYSDRVSLVVVPVTVLHPDGYFETGLDLEAFRVYEDGRRQELTCFTNEVVPLRMALLVDSSKSMRGKVRDIRKAAWSLIERLAVEDVSTVMSFDHDLVRHCEFTRDKLLLEKALKGFAPGGGTAMFDALYGAARAFRESGGKRVIILFTDGKDEKYRRPAEARRRLERAIAAVSRANITVYTIGLGKDVDHDILERIADTTGGAYFRLSEIRDLAGAYSTIFEELGSQYTLCYRPVLRERSADETPWRSIRVEVLDSELIVRHKKGYSPSG